MKGKGIVLLAAVAVLGAACSGGPGQIDVQAEEYKFGGVPDSVGSGEATFVLENVGQEPHEFSVVRIEGDFTAEELIRMGEESQQHISQVGRAFAQAGESDTLEARLEPGRYGYACFVTTEDGTPHAAEGMFGEFTVE